MLEQKRVNISQAVHVSTIFIHSQTGSVRVVRFFVRAADLSAFYSGSSGGVTGCFVQIGRRLSTAPFAAQNAFVVELFASHFS